MPKGGVRIAEHVLFGKYRLCRKLGTGRSGTVYLAFHCELEEYRAVKIVPKTITDYETFRKEALFLKTLRHSGIPLVYDVEEDLNHSYLIEEYLEGESLYALVKRLGNLSAKSAVDLGIQICRIIQFMNTAENPILYLDLQPKNLLVCGEQVRLIDFDHAQYAEDVRTFGRRYGTIGFAAPEQYLGEPLDCRTDVYAIGALLYFMCLGRPPGKEPEFDSSGKLGGLGRIIRGCMAKNKEDRYRDAKDLEDALREWKDCISKEHAIESLTIVFAGAKAGIGTTHAALGLSNFLTRNGYPALYQEEYDTVAVRSLVRRLNARADSAGVYHIGCLNIRPYYGKSIKMPYRYFPVVVKDIGSSWQEENDLPEANFYVLVCGGKLWEAESFTRAAEKFRCRKNVILLWNHMTDRLFLEKSKKFGFACGLNLPYFPDPFRADQAAEACFRELMKRGTGGNGEWKQKTGKAGLRKMRRKNRIPG